jgi:hypothetical protein
VQDLDGLAEDTRGTSTIRWKTRRSHTPCPVGGLRFQGLRAMVAGVSNRSEGCNAYKQQ